ncbi:hypothetical protein WOC76_21400 [Methylocystis sp. IM3]|uniref:hypothetical protein n=1 Tax=unclassified Methylocystis TaxID=2625913 RepID=UPI0030F6D6A3
MEKNGFVSRVHRKKPRGKPMPHAMPRVNAEKSKVRSRDEHIFAEQKDRLFVRTIGIARARVKIGMASLVYNFKRLVFWRRTAAACPVAGGRPAHRRARPHCFMPPRQKSTKISPVYCSRTYTLTPGRRQESFRKITGLSVKRSRQSRFAIGRAVVT